MFGIGETELVVILIFGFLLFGPDKLPGMGRTIGRALRQFREAQDGFTKVVQTEIVDPINKAADEPVATKKASTDELDADAEAGTDPVKGQTKPAETFAQRKARLEAERDAAKADGQDSSEAAGPEGEGPTEEGIPDAEEPAPQAAEDPEQVAAREEAKRRSVSALYGLDDAPAEGVSDTKDAPTTNGKEGGSEQA